MDLDGKLWAWWVALPPGWRSRAVTVTDAVPQWMVGTLLAAGVPLVSADRTFDDASSGTVMLMTTHLRDFLRGQRVTLEA